VDPEKDLAKYLREQNSETVFSGGEMVRRK
jgi:hypothetical protein